MKAKLGVLLILGFISWFSSMKSYIVALAVSFKTRLSIILSFNVMIPPIQAAGRAGTHHRMATIQRNTLNLLLNPITLGGNQFSDLPSFKILYPTRIAPGFTIVTITPTPALLVMSRCPALPRRLFSPVWIVFFTTFRCVFDNHSPYNHSRSAQSDPCA